MVLDRLEGSGKRKGHLHSVSDVEREGRERGERGKSSNEKMNITEAILNKILNDIFCISV
jgi:hypothetical protein